MSDASDRSSWPTQRGFDRYYGVLEGLTNLHHPHRLIRDNSPVAIDEYPKDFYLTDNLTDEAIALILAHRAESQKPFFLYFAHLAVHGPLHAKQADIAKYAGQYADGWDALRDRRFAKQIAGRILSARDAAPAAQQRTVRGGPRVGRSRSVGSGLVRALPRGLRGSGRQRRSEPRPVAGDPRRAR
jgi:arylsulfatase